MPFKIVCQRGPLRAALHTRYSLQLPAKWLLMMKLTMLMLLIATLQVHARGHAQNITLSMRNTPLDKVFKEIRKQTGYLFLYTDEQIATARTVTLEVQNQPLDKVLEQCFRSQPLVYDITGKTVIIKRKPLTTTLLNATFDGTVKGRITDDKGNAVAGAAVQEKGTSNGALTNESGNFEIKVAGTDAILVITSLGFDRQEIALKGRSNIDISLVAVAADMKELIVIGYGEQRRGAVSSAITTVSSSTFKEQPVNRLDQVLQGRAAGVQVTNSTGAPGGAVRIRIRGSNSINGDNSPLYVVDGFVGADFSAINPDDLESIQILKDAAATAIYGSRGANGVVILTTKKGAKGAARVNATARASTSGVLKKLSLLNAGDFAETANAHAVATGAASPFTQAQVDSFKRVGGTNWQDEIFRQASGKEYLLNVSGGTEKGGYFISGDYLDQDGVINNSFFKRYNLRSNINAKLNDWVTASLNIQGSYSSSQNIDIPADGPHSPLAQAITWSPTVPVRNSVGGYTATDPVSSVFFNPVALTTEQLTVTERMLANMIGGFKFRLLTGLSLNVQYGVNYLGYENKSFAGKVVNSGSSIASLRSNKEIRLQSTNTLNYHKLLHNVHSLDATAVMEYQQNTYNYMSAGASNLNYESFMWNNIALGTPGTPGSGTSKSSLFSLMGRVNYGYKDKYLLSAGLRRDGSSKFAGSNKYSYFPSVSAAWVLSEESFLRHMPVFSNLKLRGSWGLTGNQGIDAYSTYSTYSNRVASFTSTSSQTGIVLGNIGNPDLKWETTEQKDIGIELGLGKGRVAVTADYFIKDTRDLLLTETLPLYLGGNPITRNAGAVQNKGFEIGIEATVIDKEALRWTSLFNASFVKTRVISTGQNKIIFDPNNRKIGGGMSPQSEFVVTAGQPLGAIWGLTYLGTWKPGDTKAGDFGAKAGDSRYLDKTGDNVIDASDYGVIGTGVPTTSLGFNNTVSYKGFTLNIFIHALLHFDKLNYNKAAAMYHGGDAREATYVDIKNRYIPGVNESSDIPAFSTTNRNFTQSTRFLEKADFMRLKNLSLSYDLPRSVLKGKAGLKLFISATNVFTVTSYSGIDPESNSASGDIRQGIDYGSYPNVRTFTGGCTLSF
ncbi:TonB-linked outer membrane protein, SusC/RagA family [Filimonas lacunae]|uniref:TonB-linked outer membrane protein, SusC/RagA family n=1 Tax=Filimonas lacunae TaxID=477680 RepID=A0A173MHD8_9BACT|nr:TonB-dependent receptor [Filimonas lacunae]BAV06900.1 TonB-dependent receptor [Filimonas lacunae]SIS98100.1 TonB-linked outer membrane protein, SusC/RagA family [Filimonas lacunae]